VRDEDDGFACSSPDSLQLELQLAPRECINCSKRLIHEEDLGIHHQAPRNLDALLHAARELGWKFALMTRKADECDGFRRNLAALDWGADSFAQPEFHIFQHGEPWKERVADVLENHHAVRPGSHDIPLVISNFPCGGLFETRNHVEERTLAGAARA
jgi:hypothetical protein